MCQNKLILIRQISAFLLEVKATHPRQNSVDWLLLNNLNNYLHNVSNATKPSDIYHAARLYHHFCIDSLDYKSAYFKKSQEIISPGLDFDARTKK